MSRHPAQKMWLGKNGKLGPARPTAMSDEHMDDVDEILTTTLSERDRRELEQGNASRTMAIRRQER